MPLPHSVECKIFRAEEHHDAFVAQMRRRFQGHTGELIMETDPTSNVRKLTVEVPIPDIFPLILRDCLDNLRSALDYMVWELVLATKGVPSEANAFPVCDSAKYFKDAIGRRLTGLSDEMVAEIDFLQPYHRGNDFASHPFWILNKLANVNKHRRIILVTMKADWIGKVIGTERYTLASPDSEMHVDIQPTAYVALDERDRGQIPRDNERHLPVDYRGPDVVAEF